MNAVSSYIIYVMNKMELFHNLHLLVHQVFLPTFCLFFCLSPCMRIPHGCNHTDIFPFSLADIVKYMQQSGSTWPVRALGKFVICRQQSRGASQGKLLSLQQIIPRKNAGRKYHLFQVNNTFEPFNFYDCLIRRVLSPFLFSPPGSAIWVSWSKHFMDDIKIAAVTAD